MDYKGCTLEELADHIEVSTSQLITQQISYYTKRNNMDMVEKIRAARKLVRKRKILRELESMQ